MGQDISSTRISPILSNPRAVHLGLVSILGLDFQFDVGCCLRQAFFKSHPAEWEGREREVELEETETAKTKTRTDKMAESTALWLLMILFVLTFTVVSSIDDKCAACNAVAEEIEYGLSNEKPRNHLDMRHRLDSKGQRKGKVIDYRVSELRVVELLDGLCDKMQDYTLEKVETKRYEWVRVDSWDNLSVSKIWNSSLIPGELAHPISCESDDKQEAKAYSKDISSYCGRLLEETEDELAELIKKGSMKVGGVSKILCQNLSKHCKQSRDSNEVDADDDGPDGEL
ncbi:hypothetical protein OIU85_021918 [Salix viminalis]|uniref:DUF3456 domain-containing protein n=1 Tax=Salix viminalis TaxID=40686 RepID=A0A9Q0UJC5_SALVM|nr:hypothetical protein OIU85_021918 [Salix viminalis]